MQVMLLIHAGLLIVPPFILSSALPIRYMVPLVPGDFEKSCFSRAVEVKTRLEYDWEMRKLSQLV